MDKREAYKKKQQARLDEWQAELDKMKAKVSQTGADAQIKLQERLEDLEGRIQQGRTKLSELTKAGESRWDALRASIDTLLEALKAGVSEARKELDKDR